MSLGSPKYRNLARGCWESSAPWVNRKVGVFGAVQRRVLRPQSWGLRNIAALGDKPLCSQCHGEVAPPSIRSGFVLHGGSGDGGLVQLGLAAVINNLIASITKLLTNFRVPLIVPFQQGEEEKEGLPQKPLCPLPSCPSNYIFFPGLGKKALKIQVKNTS